MTPEQQILILQRAILAAMNALATSGYRSKDRQYAIDVLGSALRGEPEKGRA